MVVSNPDKRGRKARLTLSASAESANDALTGRTIELRENRLEVSLGPLAFALLSVGALRPPEA